MNRQQKVPSTGELPPFRLDTQSQSSLPQNRSIQRSAKCKEHVDEVYTNFCCHRDCMRALCPDCIERHTAYHKVNGSEADIQSLKSVKTRCKQKLTSLKNSVEQLCDLVDDFGHTRNIDDSDEGIRKIIKYRDIITETIHAYFDSLLDKYRTRVSNIAEKDELSKQIQERLSIFLEDLEQLHSKLDTPLSQADAMNETFKLDWNSELSDLERQIAEVQVTHSTFSIDVIAEENKIKHLKSELVHYVRLGLIRGASDYTNTENQTSNSVINQQIVDELSYDNSHFQNQQRIPVTSQFLSKSSQHQQQQTQLAAESSARTSVNGRNIKLLQAGTDTSTDQNNLRNNKNEPKNDQQLFTSFQPSRNSLTKTSPQQPFTQIINSQQQQQQQQLYSSVAQLARDQSYGYNDNKLQSSSEKSSQQYPSRNIQQQQQQQPQQQQQQQYQQQYHQIQQQQHSAHFSPAYQQILNMDDSQERVNESFPIHEESQGHIDQNPFGECQSLMGQSSQQIMMFEMGNTSQMPNISVSIPSYFENSCPFKHLPIYIPTTRAMYFIDISYLSNSSINQEEEQLHHIQSQQPLQSSSCEFIKSVPIAELLGEFHKLLITPRGDIYAMGGLIKNVEVSKVYRFDYTEQQFVERSPMCSPRSSFSAVFLEKSSIFVIGGKRDGRATAECERYDIVANKWMSIASLHHAVYASSACTFGKWNIYKFGGIGPDLQKQNNVIERYSLQRNIWEVIPLLHEDISGTHPLYPANFSLLFNSGCSQISENTIYVFGGQYKKSPSRQNFCFEVTKTEKADLHVLNAFDYLPLTHEGTFTTNPIIYNDTLIAIQNVESSAVVSHQQQTNSLKRITTFDGFKWTTKTIAFV